MEIVCTSKFAQDTVVKVYMVLPLQVQNWPYHLERKKRKKKSLEEKPDQLHSQMKAAEKALEKLLPPKNLVLQKQPSPDLLPDLA